MKRFLIPGAIGVAILTATGFTVAELTEYGQVARNALQSSIQDSIPIDVELQRLEVLLDKVDAKTLDQKRIVAKAQIELENAETLLSQARRRQEAVKSAMAAVRNGEQVYVSSKSGTRCGGVVTVPANEQLAQLLTSYKTFTSTVTAREKAVVAHRHAVESLTSRFQEWSQERETLRQQLDSLRARHAATQIATVQQPGLATGELSRASELFQRLDQRLKIEERTQEDLDLQPIQLSGQSTDDDALAAEIDEILGNDNLSESAS